MINIEEFFIMIGTLVEIGILKHFYPYSNGNVVSLGHAFVQTLFSIIQLGGINISVTCEALKCTKTDVNLQVIVLFTYTLADLYLHRNQKTEMIVHHIIVCIMCVISRIFNDFKILGTFVLLNEASTIFLNLRILRPSFLCDVMFVVTFFILRILGLPFVFWQFIKCEAPIGVLMALFCHVILNYYWGFKIVKNIIKDLI